LLKHSLLFGSFITFFNILLPRMREKLENHLSMHWSVTILNKVNFCVPVRYLEGS
jgi:hypothetical protein